jgi:NDP-sugar pyrophosphorylase family protein
MEGLSLWHSIDSRLAPYIEGVPPWQVLDDLPDLLARIGATLDEAYVQLGLQIWVHRTAQLAKDAHILAPCIIDEGAIVRPQAYLRGSVWVGKGAMVGHASELKNTILLQHAAAPHFNYVGDSVLGAYAHLGAGAVLSNLRQDKSPVVVQIGGARHPTNRRKMGALVGDFAEIGCNAVLNPGTVVASHAVVRPLQSVKGYIAAE